MQKAGQRGFLGRLLQTGQLLLGADQQRLRVGHGFDQHHGAKMGDQLLTQAGHILRRLVQPVNKKEGGRRILGEHCVG